jgi:glucose/arabinose dehydrogenase
MRAPPRNAATLLVLGMLLAACSGGGEDGAAPATTTAPTTSAPPATEPGPTTSSPPAASSAQFRRARVRLVRVATLQQPVAMAVRPGDQAIYVVEQVGRVRAIRNGRLDPTPVVDISGQVTAGGEQGLLGIAFAPDGRILYLDFTDRNGDTRVVELAMRGGRADPGSQRLVLQVDQPYANHNGGMLAFGPGGYLYIGLGDGGGADDPGNRAQNTGTLLGKMLRIDVNGKTPTRGYDIPSSNPYVGRSGRNEIWQVGLRNPWRFSFDRQTAAMWIGDVGQGSYEEINRAVHTSTGSGRGYNWGWRVMEGRHCHIPSSGCRTSGKVLPLTEYTQALNGRCAVTGGYVYRGSRIPALVGYYVFGDFCSGEIWAIRANSSYPPARITLAGAGSGRNISSFGESATGELFVVDLGGTISLIEPSV